MVRGGDAIKDMRLAAIAPAVLIHAIAAGIFLSLSPDPLESETLPPPVEFVVADIAFVDELPAPEPETPEALEQDRAGNVNAPDPRLGRTEGGELEQAAIVNEQNFDALGESVDGEIGSSALEREAAQAGRLGEGGDRIVAVQMALRRHACRKLTEYRDPTCPKEDPFEKKLMLASLRNAPPVVAFDQRELQPGSIVEQMMAANAAPETNLPFGMTEALFNEPMAPGAYDAQRIQNGQAPLWLANYRASLNGSDVSNN